MEKQSMGSAFHLTPDLMAAAYDYLRESKPFRAWRLPKSDEVEFHVTRHRDIFGDHMMVGEKHVIRASATNVGTTAALMRVMAHEMIHAHCDRRGVRGEHGKDFQAAADKVCRFHGFDRKGF